MVDSADKSPMEERGWLAKLPSPKLIAADALRNPLRALILGGGCILGLVILFGLFRPLMVGRPMVSDVEAALLAIDRGDYEEAKLIAARMYEKELPFEIAGTPYYVLGAASGLEAEATLDARRKNELLVLATRYLEEAEQRGWPPGRETDGSLRLARHLFDSGQYARSLPYVKQAIESSKKPLPEAERLLAGAYSRDSNPSQDKALTHIDKYLSAETLTDAQRRVGQLDKAKILIALKRFSEAHALLASVPPTDTNSDLLLVQGELALAESNVDGASDRGAIERAIAILQSAIDRDPSNPLVTAPGNYLIGLAKRQNGDIDGALRHFSNVGKLHGAMPEGWSSSLVAGEIYLLRGENEAALEVLKTAALSAGAAPSYSNPWIPLVEFRSRLREAYSNWIERNEFALANEFAKVLPPLVTESESVQMRAEAYRRWAENLAQQALNASVVERELIEGESRLKHRMAAKLFAWLADLNYATAQYPDHLWQSSEQFLSGHDYDQASHMLTTYLEVELRHRRPEALTALAKAYLALGDFDKAANYIDDVLENYQTHPVIYQARLVASAIELERRIKGADDELVHLAKARALLEANLNEEALTPRSLEWRDSLFELGKVLTIEATALETSSRIIGVDFRDDEETVKIGLRELENAVNAYKLAIRRLEEATRRYPDAPQAILARYRLAESYRNAAKLPRKKLPLVLIQTTRVQLQREMIDQLSRAYGIYKQLQADLNSKQERLALTDIELSILRNCYFSRADCLFDQGRYEEAIREYSTATNRYQHDPAALEAFVQIASAYRLLGRPYEARGTLEQAKVVLDRIRDEANFAAVTRYDREEWANLLDLLSTL